MKILVLIGKGDGSKPDRQWVNVGDSVVFTHTAQIALADGSEVPAGPPRRFTVEVLAAQADEIADSEYIPPINAVPEFAGWWDRMAAVLGRGNA